MKKEEIEEILARAERATPEPWIAGRFGLVSGGPEIEYINGSSRDQVAMARLTDRIGTFEQDSNAEFIAHARTDVPALCRELLEVQEQIEKVRRLFIQY